jgi:beta-N-acetylhexosaminidase
VPRLGLYGFALAAAMVAVLALWSGSASRLADHHQPQKALLLTHSLALPEADQRALIEARAGTRPLTLTKAVGQLLIGTYAGVQPPASILKDVRAGRLGGVILMGANTAAGVAATHTATDALQAASRAGGNPGLLIMTDQEGGEVKRLEGPPEYPAAGMADAALARQQGAATAQLLRQAGVNVDLAPVADVSRTDGFMTQEQRTFGSDGHGVARSVCAFARGLAASGVAYTLKHFPGLGDATQNTDGAPVGVAEPANQIRADDAPYRRCGRGPLALVMVSSASYDQLTGSTPAVLSPYIYRTVMKRDGIDAVTISDSFESGAISVQQSPARAAINAGLDMVLYPGYEATCQNAYDLLLQDARAGTLHPGRVLAAARKVLTLKANLGLG